MPHLQPHPQRLLFPQYFPPRMVFPHQYGGGSGPGRLHYLPPAANFTHQMPLHPYLVSGGRALQCLSDLSCACEDSLLFVLLCSYYVFWSRVIIFLTECQMFPLLRILPMINCFLKCPRCYENFFCRFQIGNVMVQRLIGSNYSRVPRCTATRLLPLDELVLEAWRKMP